MPQQEAHGPGLDKDPFSIANIYVAYKKAKMEAFFENSHPQALAFTQYEQNLHRNLERLAGRLQRSKADWPDDLKFIGDYAYIPKSIATKAWEAQEEGHFRALHPLQDWMRRFRETGTPATASLRLVIRPTVDFQIVSALWILVVGYKFDSALDKDASYGNRLRYGPSNPLLDSGGRRPNMTSPALFAPYFSGYREWRERGLTAMEDAVKGGTDVLAVTMDIERFYHRVAPEFLLRPQFLEAIGVSLAPDQVVFTESLLRAIGTWYRSTPDSRDRPEGAIPVGLSASKIISNVLLAEFDRTIRRNIGPIYYGRYVDDIFLVMKGPEGEFGATSVIGQIVSAMFPMLLVKPNSEGPPSLTLQLPYAQDSELVFAGAKQKMFALSSKHGLDLVHHIRDQIRQQSSEYRLLPSVPMEGSEMAARALLANSSASLQADAVRKADAVSVKRLGFSLLLSDIETYAADLQAHTWKKTRSEFYELVKRHVVTPVGFFDFSGYIPRVFGLMVSCGDFEAAEEFVAEVAEVALILEQTCDFGQKESNFELCRLHYGRALLEAALQAATLARSESPQPALASLLRSIRKISPRLTVPRGGAGLTRLIRQMLLADWGRRPYKEYWYQEQNVDEVGPRIPRNLSIRRQLRLGSIRRFRQTGTQLKRPHWPALTFPTRPLKIDEIALVAPDVLQDARVFRNIIKVLRGAEVVSDLNFGFQKQSGEHHINVFAADDRPRKSARIAVTSVHTTLAQWQAAAKGKHDRSARRYQAINNLINRVISERRRPHYIVFPELSIPLRWAIRIARKLASNGVSLLAGIEYHKDRVTRKLRNDCLLSLTTRWPGYPSHVVVLQPKFAPARAEEKELKKALGKTVRIYRPTGWESNPTIYQHRDFYFSSLICSDLTNVSNRNAIRGLVDAVFALEWNPDTKTFSPLVEATANDLHAYVVQVNNRKYGDSRIRCPATNDYERDVVQVKGGAVDYYVLGDLDIAQLRREQRRQVSKPKFKPTPIGYVMSKARKAKS